MDHPSKFTPVVFGTIIMSLIAIVPLLNLINLFCCAGVILGGAAGVFYYSSQLNKIGETVQYKDGAAIGVLSGIISAIIVTIFPTLLSILLKQNPIPDLYKVFDQSGFMLPPEAESLLRKISDEYSKNGFSITLTLMSLGINIVMYPLFGLAGGLLAAAIASKKKNAV